MTDLAVEALDPTAPLDVREMAWLRRILPLLYGHYPGYNWLVAVDVLGGVANIGLPLPDRSGVVNPWAWVINLETYSDAKAIRAGGEMLERWRLSRERAPSDPGALARSNGLDVGGVSWAPNWATKLA